MNTQYSCPTFQHLIPGCQRCPIKQYCSVYMYVMDLTAERLTCKACGETTREEHVQYCPFCGYKDEPT
ncbi:hypothetical protein GWN49_08275 [Candidatus Bathyarchaeota archaeon]|nr:hypothetical protein [Candidatus Bathyarchaeota archaeon]